MNNGSKISNCPNQLFKLVLRKVHFTEQVVWKTVHVSRETEDN
ncbi:hypothetical protein SAMN05216315_10510 [Nitrosospira sp. Nsp18]|nr:hypothetical protein SAMN05216315_10510 [Nitrosospira sp. Nsp18]